MEKKQLLELHIVYIITYGYKTCTYTPRVFIYFISTTPSEAVATAAAESMDDDSATKMTTNGLYRRARARW